MINKERLQQEVIEYKKHFTAGWWEAEKYKWEAIKTFQDNWALDATDFADMLSRSLAKTANLLTAHSYLAREMIKELAQTAPEVVRGMFRALYDEKNDVADSVLAFMHQADEFVAKQGDKKKHSFQDLHAIATYLWLRFPDKYYIYKISEVKRVAKVLEYGYPFTQGQNHYYDNLKNFYSLYDEVCENISKDSELIKLFKSELTVSCYPDPQYRTLATDIAYFIANKPSPPSPPSSIKPYTKKDFLEEVFMSETAYDKNVRLLRNKKNIILQGAPGVGKTYAAHRLAYSIMGEWDTSRVEIVQFHQNYSYEDFIMGYKPSEDGFELKTGKFYNFCTKAANKPDSDFFFIIDEINRGNMSKIFGELLMLIENDYRGESLSLAYDGRPFYVPKNLYIIGMMNTADRSLAMIDYALRRRFSFIEMNPAFDSEGFKQYQKNLNDAMFDQLIDNIVELNKAISNDGSLGKGFMIGHSYFCNWPKQECTKEKMSAVVEHEIIPMLEEYWFDEESKLNTWRDRLLNVIK